MYFNLERLNNAMFIVVATVSLLCFVYQVVYYLLSTKNLKEKDTEDNTKIASTSLPPVSLVICMRDQLGLFRKKLQFIIDQEYPVFEIVVVNISTEKNSSESLETWARQIPNLQLINIYEKNNFTGSKLFPLSIGVKAAKHDIIITTDLNCTPASVYWLRALVVNSLNAKVDNVIGIANYKKLDKTANKIARFEQSKFNYKLLYHISQNRPLAVCTKNFLFSKHSFLQIKNISSYFSLKSDGTSIFNKYINSENTSFCYKDYEQVLLDLKNTKSWMQYVWYRRQNLKYTSFKNKLRLFFFDFSLLLFLIGLIVAIVFYQLYIIATILFVLRYLLWLRYTIKMLKLLDQRDLIGLVTVFELLLLFMRPFIIIFGRQKGAKLEWI